MTSNTVPIYRRGRKFYVSIEEYERIRSEERRQRRTAVLISQNLPISKFQQTSIRSPATTSYNSIQRNNSNLVDYKYGILKTSFHSPVNSLINTNNRHESNRLSRSRLKSSNDQDDLSSVTSTSSKSKKSLTSIRSHSSDKILDIRRTSLPSHIDNEIEQSLPQQKKLKQQLQNSSRRTVPTTVSDYGISPIQTFSMTSQDQTYTQTNNNSTLTNYFARMKQSSLNPSSTTLPSAISGTGSLFETSMQGSDHVYTILGTSNRRIGDTGSSSLLTRSISDSNNKNDYYHRDTTSGSLSDDNSSSLSALFQRQNIDINRYRKSNELDDDSIQQRDLWTRSTIRSQSSDGLTEKKRVRFADMEGFTLETIPKKTQLNNHLLSKRKHIKVSNNIQRQLQPQSQHFSNSLYQTTTKIGESKLATDV